MDRQQRVSLMLFFATVTVLLIDSTRAVSQMQDVSEDSAAGLPAVRRPAVEDQLPHPADEVPVLEAPGRRRLMDRISHGFA